MYQYLGSTDILLYDALGSLSSIIIYLFNILQYKRKKNLQSYSTQYLQNFFYKLKPGSKINILAFPIIWIILEIALFSYVQYELTGFVNRTFGDMVGTGANYFGKLYHIPFLLVAICILFWVDPLKQIDLITPAYPLALVIAKLACFCQGCCRGIEWAGGLYNHSSERYEFPVQLVEAGLALLIFIFLMFWRDKAKPGTMFPTYLILYSATRFFSEFLRHEENVFGILKTYHILCIIGVIVGIVELLIALKFGKDISDLFSETHYFIPNDTKKKNKKKKKKTASKA